MYDTIREKFCRRFKTWEITINEEDLFLGNQKTIPAKDWLLKWVLQEDEKGPYIEYYAIHDTREHLHERIYNDGNEERLDVLKQYIVYSPNIPGDRERSARDFERFNRSLMRELQQKGLI